MKIRVTKRANHDFLRNLQDQLGNIVLIVIDEIGMISAKELGTVDKVLRKATRREDQIFGGIHYIFTGDHYQLPPVGNWSTPLCATPIDKEKESDSAGLFAYRSITTYIELLKNFRFENSLLIEKNERIRLGLVTKEDEEDFNLHIE
jgi:hypothetical protein